MEPVVQINNSWISKQEAVAWAKMQTDFEYMLMFGESTFTRRRRDQAHQLIYILYVSGKITSEEYDSLHAMTEGLEEDLELAEEILKIKSNSTPTYHVSNIQSRTP